MPPLPVLIPVNSLERAKGRLASLLAPAEREALAVATLWTVLDAVTEAGARPIVLTADPRVRAALPGILLIPEDPSISGLNAQLQDAVDALQPLDALLILHADLPLATPAAIAALVTAAPPAASATAVQSQDGGTNAMLLRPPGRFPLAYGPGSFEHHRTAALAAGATFTEAAVPALTLDLDTPADIATLLATEDGRASRAGRLLLLLNVESRQP